MVFDPHGIPSLLFNRRHWGNAFKEDNRLLAAATAAARFARVSA
jgi:hypothetical protein